MYRSAHVLEVVLAERGCHDLGVVADRLVDLARDTDPTAIRKRKQPGCDVDTIPVDLVAIHQHVRGVDRDVELEVLTFDGRFDAQRTVHRVQRIPEERECLVTQSLDELAPIAGNLAPNQLPVPPLCPQTRFFAPGHEGGRAHEVREHDGRQPALRGHGDIVLGRVDALIYTAES